MNLYLYVWQTGRSHHPRTGCQSVAGNFSSKTGTHLHLGIVRKWRWIIFPKDKTHSTDAWNRTANYLLPSSISMKATCSEHVSASHQLQIQHCWATAIWAFLGLFFRPQPTYLSSVIIAFRDSEHGEMDFLTRHTLAVDIWRHQPH